MNTFAYTNLFLCFLLAACNVLHKMFPIKIQITQLLTPCQDKQKLPISFENIRYRTTEEGWLLINYNTKVTQNIQDKISMELAIDKCRNKENLNSCFRFNTYKSNEFCEAAVAKDQFWSPFLNCLKPKYECPLKKMIYRGTNCSFDISKFRMFPLDGSFWKIKMQYTNVLTKTKLACAFVGVTTYS